MRQRHVRHRLDLHYLEYPQIRLPLVEPIKRIMVGAEVYRQDWPANRSVEHPAQSHSINEAAVDAKSNNAPRVLIHHDENPMCSQGCGFARKQIGTPEAVLHVTNESEP